MNQELKPRIITGIILLTLVLFLLFKANDQVFAVAVAVLVLLAAWEWTGVAKVSSVRQKIIYLMLVLLCILSAVYLKFWLYLGLAFWLGALFWLPGFPTKTRFIFNNKYLILSAGLLVLIPAWQAIVNLANDRLIVLFLLLVIWAADIGAYSVGKKFGKTKLAPNVSPSKTFEGVGGGLLLALIVGLIFLMFSGGMLIAGFIFILFIVLFSIVGDLVESAYKREANLKDSGNILPGHGGVMDRIDSLTAAAPVFYLLLKTTS